MSDLVKVTKICPYREPNEVYRSKNKTYTDEADATSAIEEYEYEIQRIPPPCAEGLCGVWDAVERRCRYRL